MAYASSNTDKFYNGFPTPGPQNPSSAQVMNHIYFADEAEWKNAREDAPFDYIVIGTGFCAFAFIERVMANAKEVHNSPIPRILVLERGTFFLPEHFQNLPSAFKYSTPSQQHKSETFPWTLCRDAAVREDGASWQHGMVPFFGGRSTLWSGWCPEPSDVDLEGWPQELIDMIRTDHFFDRAKELLGVRFPSEVPSVIPKKCRVYANLQGYMLDLLASEITALDEKIIVASEAPLAIQDNVHKLDTFEKYSVVGPFLKLLHEYPDNITVATNCCVEKIGMQDGNVPTHLETSRGVLPLSQNSKIILGVGCMPAATLLLNSYPKESIPNVGNKFSAHFITAVTARIHRSAFDLTDLNDFELGALYLGCVHPSTGLTYHAQISILSDEHPVAHEAEALKYMPDVVSTASMEQLIGSEDYIVFVFAWLGELKVTDANKFQSKNSSMRDRAANILLQYQIDEDSGDMWNSMDKMAEDVLVKVFAKGDQCKVNFWDFSPDTTSCKSPPPATGWSSDFKKLRVPGMVHESSVVSIGPEETDSTGYDFRPYGTKQVYVTGSGLWPTGKSWNPTLTMCALAQRLADNFRNESRGNDASERDDVH